MASVKIDLQQCAPCKGSGIVKRGWFAKFNAMMDVGAVERDYDPCKTCRGTGVVVGGARITIEGD